MEIGDLPAILKLAYKEKFVQTENWARTNSDNFNFFENIKISSDSDFIDKALALLKRNSSETLEKSGSTKKSNKKSTVMREKANELFKKKFWLDALKSYSKSIALAENGSTELGFAYANRSALLLHRGFYKECLEDIERALQLNYPQEKKPQLISRQKKATELLPSQKKKIVIDDLPTLKSKNSELRGATDAVKLSENEQYGRFIEATKDLHPGDVIVIEDPYVLMIGQDFKTTHCGDCGKLCFNTIPCKRCSIEMYCSEQCRDIAYESYHSYECVVINYYPKEVFDIINLPFESRDLTEINKEQIRQLSLRLTLKGFRTYQTNYVDTSEDLYEEVGKLQTHRKDLNKSALMILAFNCAKQFHTLKKHTNFFSKLRFKDKEDILKYHLLRNRLICCFSLSTLQYRLDESIHGQSNLTVGLGLYPTYSMFNHACVENVGYGFFGKTLVMRAIRTIKKGEQCFVNYGHFFQDEPKLIRHIRMHQNYLFTCKCEACEKEWPVFNGNLSETHISSATNLKLQLLTAVMMSDKHPDEKVKEEMFKACVKAEHSINVEGPNVNLLLYYNLISLVLLSRYQGNDF